MATPEELDAFVTLDRRLQVAYLHTLPIEEVSELLYGLTERNRNSIQAAALVLEEFVVSRLVASVGERSAQLELLDALLKALTERIALMRRDTQ